MSALTLTLCRVLTCAYILLFAWLGSVGPLPGVTTLDNAVWVVWVWLLLTTTASLLYALMRIEPLRPSNPS